MVEPRRPTPATPDPDSAGNPRPAGRYVTIEELSAATTLSVSTIRRLVKKGSIVGHQPGGPRTRIVFRPDAIEQASGAAAPSGEQPDPNAGDAPPRGPRPRWLRETPGAQTNPE
jgi:excisionase family DNA binding protein